MARSKVLLLGLVFAAAIVVLPALMPSGPTASLDAAGSLETGQFSIALGLIFLGGLLTALTPCVYPLIPVTVGVFGARQAKSRAHAVLLTASYVVGMGVVFSALGVTAAMVGKAFGSSLGNPWVVAGIGVFLLVLASSMFGAFELALPTGLATRLNSVGGGGPIGAFLMGSVSGFLAAPCTGPVLNGVLAYVAKQQRPVEGAILLFVYALGIGVPFFLLGVFTVRLPKSGVWMEWIKSFFGVALVALALGYFRDASPQLRSAADALGEQLGKPGGVALAAVLIFVGVLLGGIHRSFKDGAWSDSVLKAAGVAAMVIAVPIRTTASTAPAVGQLQLALGLVGPAQKAAVQHAEAAGHAEIPWDAVVPSRGSSQAPLEELDGLLARAKADGRPVMIDFFAEWCEACKELDRDVYVQPSVIGASKQFVNIKLDATDEEKVSAILSRYEVLGLPTVMFFDPAGNEQKDLRIIGYVPAESFLAVQQRATAPRCDGDADCPNGKHCKAIACADTPCTKRCG